MTMGKSKRLITILGTLMLSLAVLSACGDSTATPASSGAAVPTSASTPKATTAPASATTAAPTTASTTTIIGPNLSNISGLTEVPVSDALRQTFSNQLNLGNIDLHCYTSDTDPGTIATSFDTTLTGQGYQFAIPGMSKPIAEGTANFGLYSNTTNGSDVLLIVAPVPATMASTDATSLPGINQDDFKQLLSQVQGHKTFAITLTGTNLMQGLMSMMANSGGSSNTSNTSNSSTPGTTPVTTP